MVKSLAIQQECRSKLKAALEDWLAEMGKGDKDSELSRARQRLEFLATKRKTIKQALKQILGSAPFFD